MKKILLIAVLLVVGYFGTRYAAGYSLAKQIGACATQVNSAERLKAAKSDRERSDIMLTVIECTESKISFPGSLMFDKEKILATLK